jgi:FAD:protein FMN transferase
VKQTQIIMGMPITVELVGLPKAKNLDQVFAYFHEIDQRFSPYKKNSELASVNDGLAAKYWSKSMREIMRLCDQTKRLSNGYFDIEHAGKLDPSGLVKGWAIYQAVNMLRKQKLEHFYIEAGGDIEVGGLSSRGTAWRIGIRNPNNIQEIVKAVELTNMGIATSGTYIRGQHIYNPKSGKVIKDVVSLSVIGPNIYEADRFATAAFAMGKTGIDFIEKLAGFEGYLIDNHNVATYTSGFSKYVVT